jgi:general secretion pathway protein G
MCHAYAAQRQSGASRLELLVAAAAVAAVAGVLLERFAYYQEYLEKVAMDLTIASMRAGLRSQVAGLLIADRVSEIQTLADRNPISWLEHPPENYLGELDSPPEKDARGKWYFDGKRRELVYTANNRRHFTPSVYRDYTVRVRPMRVRAADDGSRPGARREPEWVVLVVVNDYQWF